MKSVKFQHDVHSVFAGDEYNILSFASTLPSDNCFITDATGSLTFNDGTVEQQKLKFKLQPKNYPEETGTPHLQFEKPDQNACFECLELVPTPNSTENEFVIKVSLRHINLSRDSESFSFQLSLSFKTSRDVSYQSNSENGENNVLYSSDYIQ